MTNVFPGRPRTRVKVTGGHWTKLTKGEMRPVLHLGGYESLLEVIQPEVEKFVGDPVAFLHWIAQEQLMLKRENLEREAAIFLGNILVAHKEDGEWINVDNQTFLAAGYPVFQILPMLFKDEEQTIAEFKGGWKR